MRFSVPSEGEGAVGLGPTCMFSSVSLLTERNRHSGVGIPGLAFFNPGTRDNATKTVIGLHLYEIPIELSSLMNLSVTMGLLLH